MITLLRSMRGGFLLVVFCAAAAITVSAGQRSNAPAAVSPTPSPTVASSGGGLTSDQVDEYRRMKLEKAVQDSVIEWAQTRFWIVTIVGFFVGLFGIRMFAQQMIVSEMKAATTATAKAEAAAEYTAEVTKGLRADADKFKLLVDELGARADGLSTTVKTVEESLKEVRNRIEAEAGHAIATADLKIAALSDEVRQLSKLCTTIAERTSQSAGAVTEYRDASKAIRQAATDNETQFAENAKFTVYVAHHKHASLDAAGEAIVRELAKAGFKAAASPWAPGRGYIADATFARVNYVRTDVAAAERVAAIMVPVLTGTRYATIPLEMTPTDPVPNHAAGTIWVFFWLPESERPPVQA